MFLTRSRVQLGGDSDGDQLPGKVAGFLFQWILRAKEQDGGRATCGDLPTGDESGDRTLRGLLLLWSQAGEVRETKCRVDQHQRVRFARDGEVLIAGFERRVVSCECSDGPAR